MTTLYIHRRENGGAYVSPSPAILAKGKPFMVRNLTEGLATVKFPEGLTKPPAGEIGHGKAESFTVEEDVKEAYYEYDVSISGKRGEVLVVDHAYGNSRPGVIIDR